MVTAAYNVRNVYIVYTNVYLRENSPGKAFVLIHMDWEEVNGCGHTANHWPFQYRYYNISMEGSKESRPCNILLTTLTLTWFSVVEKRSVVSDVRCHLRVTMDDRVNFHTLWDWATIRCLSKVSIF